MHTYDDQSMQEHNNDHKKLKPFSNDPHRIQTPTATGWHTLGLKIQEFIDQPKHIIVGYDFS